MFALYLRSLFIVRDFPLPFKNLRYWWFPYSWAVYFHLPLFQHIQKGIHFWSLYASDNVFSKFKPINLGRLCSIIPYHARNIGLGLLYPLYWGFRTSSPTLGFLNSRNNRTPAPPSVRCQSSCLTPSLHKQSSSCKVIELLEYNAISINMFI